MTAIENNFYEQIYFTITVQVGVLGRIFKPGQQFKWSYKFFTKDCDCGSGFWTYMLEEQIDDCKLERSYPVVEFYGCEDTFKREWVLNTWVEDRQGVDKDIWHQPHQKGDNPKWYTKDGYLKPEGL